MGALVVPAATHENQASDLVMDHLTPKRHLRLGRSPRSKQLLRMETEDGIRGSVHTAV